ncbi:MAG: LacI family transcriptional regulator [Actinobacteria bacterium]|nr:LacI family transcriptional regulator [Actinomycetota bacterium]
MNSKNKKKDISIKDISIKDIPIKDITIKDIAKEAGVSLGTVSNFFNRRAIVSNKLSKRIQKVISKHNYRINLSASSLRGKITKMIGVIIPDSSSVGFSFVTKEIEKLAHEFGYSVVVCNSDNNFEAEVEYVNVLKSRNVDGIIVLPSKEDIKIFDGLDLNRVPVVLINRKIDNSNVDYVTIDMYGALTKAINYLVGLKHKKIAIMIREVDLAQSKERLKAYKDGLKNNNIDFNKKFIISGPGFFVEDGYKDMVQILNLEDRPTAVIAYNDNMAIGAIKAIKDHNLKIPDDFSIIGFDNIYIDDYLEPTLTSLTFQKKEIANKAFNLLLKRMNGDKGIPQGIIVSSSLVIRNSTGENRKN